MLKEAIDRILQLASPEIIDIGTGESARKFSSGVIHAIKRPMPETLAIHSLQGLIDYIKFEDIEIEPFALFVNSHTEVALRSAVLPPEAQRDCRIVAKFEASAHHFGNNLAIDTFIVWLLSRFAASPDREAVIKLVGNLVTGVEIQAQDDGFTQKVTVRAGVARRAEVDCPNPVYLRPYRTFAEVEQPLVPFILRLKTDKDEAVTASLHEADGGAWMIQARADIAAWLRGKTDVPVIA